MDRAKQFRESAARANQGRTKTGWRYSAELRDQAVSHVRERRQSGDSWAELSEELGVSAVTLGRWLEAESLARFYPVKVGKAIRYMLKRWDALTLFIENPLIPLDNNAPAQTLLRAPAPPRVSFRP